MTDNPFNAQRYNDRDLIEALVGSFYILDYGFVSKVNPDKTIDVTHAKRMTSRYGEVLPETVSKNIQVLTFSGAGFSLNLDVQKGDKVLLLGLKNYVQNVADVATPEVTSSTLHYTRETLKALPLCLFNSQAKVQIEVEKGKMTINTEGKLEINGNSKQFVTWAELNSALQSLWSAIQTHTHLVSTTGSAAAQSGTAAASTELATQTLDISNAKTTTVVTGG